MTWALEVTNLRSAIADTKRRSPDREVAYLISDPETLEAGGSDTVLDDLFTSILQSEGAVFRLLVRDTSRLSAYFKAGERRLRQLVGASEKDPEFGFHPLWLGVSIADQAEADSQLPSLLRLPASTYFVLLEPLRGPIDLTRIDFGFGPKDDALSGFASGPNFKKIGSVLFSNLDLKRASADQRGWLRSIAAQCHAARVSQIYL